MGIMDGLMAGANFGTGYFQGRQQAQQNSDVNTLNRLAIENTQQQMQAREQQAISDQAISDRAMQEFSAFAPPANAQPGQAQPMQVPEPPKPEEVVSKLNNLAVFAASRGDLAKANELWTQASNLNSAAAKTQTEEAAIQTAQIKKQQAHYQLAAQVAGSVPDSPDGFQQWKVAMLSDPNTPDVEMQNIRKMQYYPGIMQKIQQSGMTASQQATIKLREQTLGETQRYHNAMIDYNTRKELRQAAHDKAMEEHSTTQTKAGVIQKAPTDKETEIAVGVIRNNLGDTAQQVDSDQLNLLANNIAGQAKALMAANKALSYPQAVAIAVEQAQKSGALTVEKTPDTHTKIFGLNIPLTGESPVDTIKYKQIGATPSNPADFTGQKPNELIPGNFYKTSQGVMQWDGSNWVPQG